MERGGLVLGGTILPTAQEETEPWACQSAHGGLRRFPLGALRLVGDPRPASLPERCGGPRDARVPEALGTREAPVPPGLRAAACGDRCDPGILVPCGGGARAFPLGATGDEPPGGADGTGAWERRAQGDIGRALRALRAGGITGCQRLHGAPAWGDKRLDEPGMGSAHARSGGPGAGRLDGVEARCYYARCAPRVVAAEGCQRGAPGAWCGGAGRPAAHHVTAQGGSCVLAPVEHRWARVLQGAREAVGAPDGGVDDAAAVCAAWVERAHAGARWLERRERIAMGEEPCALACGIRGGVCGPARGAGVARARQRQRREGQEDQQVIRAPGGAQGPLGACEADSHGGASAPCASRADPRREGPGRVRAREALACCGARSLETPLRCGIRPVKAHKGAPCVG